MHDFEHNNYKTRATFSAAIKLRNSVRRVQLEVFENSSVYVFQVTRETILLLTLNMNGQHRHEGVCRRWAQHMAVRANEKWENWIVHDFTRDKTAKNFSLIYPSLNILLNSLLFLVISRCISLILHFTNTLE